MKSVFPGDLLGMLGVKATKPVEWAIRWCRFISFVGDSQLVDFLVIFLKLAPFGSVLADSHRESWFGSNQGQRVGRRPKVIIL